MTIAKKSTSQKILNTTAFLSKGTTKFVCRQQVVQLCGSPKDESYKDRIAILVNEKKYIDEIGNMIRLTPAGLGHAERELFVSENQEALDKAKDKITMTESKKVFEFLQDGKAYTSQEILAGIGCDPKSDPKAHHFNNILAPLQMFGYVECVDIDEKTVWYLSEKLFPFGCPSEK